MSFDARRTARLCAACVVVAGLIAAAALVQAHPDPGGPEVVNDNLTLTQLIVKGQPGDSHVDDFLNDKSEYCLRLTTTHPGHPLEEIEEFLCREEVDWDKKTDGGKKYIELGRLPLVGASGFLATSLTMGFHQMECVPSAEWRLRVQLIEVNVLDVQDVIDLVAEAAEEVGEELAKTLPMTGAAQKLKLGGKLAKIAGRVLDKIFSDAENLGLAEFVWQSGAGDPDRTIAPVQGNPKIAQDFEASALKTVTRQPETCPLAQPSPTRPTPGPSPSPSPSTPGVGSNVCNGKHGYCKNGRAADSAFGALKNAGRAIDDVRSERGRPERIGARMRGRLIELVGSVAQGAAGTELEEASEDPELVTETTMRTATALMEDGDSLFGAALEARDTTRLVRAIDRYQAVFALLVPELHPEFNETGYDSVFVTDEGFAPQTIEVGPGETVHWFLDSNTERSHNVAGAFFSSGPPSTEPLGFAVAFSAGTFGYFDFGTDSSGTVAVAPRVADGPDGPPFRVTWADSESNTGDRFDVQYRTDGGEWRRWLAQTTAFGEIFGRSGEPVAVDEGREYEVRARSRSGGFVSGWSPPTAFAP